jgi:hypothetical protein
MARTVLTPQTITKNQAAVVSYANADHSNGMLFKNDGNTSLHVKNGGEGACNLTITSVADPFGRTGDITIAIPAGDDVQIPVLDPLLFNQTGSDIGNVYVDFDESTSVTIAAIRRG